MVIMVQTMHTPSKAIQMTVHYWNDVHVLLLLRMELSSPSDLFTFEVVNKQYGAFWPRS